MLSPMPCVTFCNVLVFYGTVVSSSQLLCWRYAIFSMSWTVCSVFSQPPSVSGGRLVHPQHENAFPNSRVGGPPPGGGPSLLIPMRSHLHSTHEGRLVRLRREKHDSACCIMLHSHMFDTWRALLLSSASVAARGHGSVGRRLRW